MARTWGVFATRVVVRHWPEDVGSNPTQTSNTRKGMFQMEPGCSPRPRG